MEKKHDAWIKRETVLTIRGNSVIGGQNWVKANEVMEGEPAPMQYFKYVKED